MKRLYSMKVEGASGQDYSVNTPLKSESSMYGLAEHKSSLLPPDSKNTIVNNR